MKDLVRDLLLVLALAAGIVAFCVFLILVSGARYGQDLFANIVIGYAVLFCLMAPIGFIVRLISERRFILDQLRGRRRRRQMLDSEFKE